MAPSLHVVYVNYRSNAHLLRSLESVRANEAEVGDGGVEITVVDNSMNPEVSRALVEAIGDLATCVVSEENVGFAAGCNRGAALGTAPLLLFLNPDTIVAPATLGLLVDALRRDSGLVVGPRHFADDGRLFAHAPMRGARMFDEIHDLLFARGWAPRRPDRYLAMRGRLAETRASVPVRCLSGGCLGIGRAAFGRIGGWNEDYWMYGEDVEFSVRARRRGLHVRYLPHAEIVHEMEVSAKQRPEEVAASRVAGRQRFKRARYGAMASRLETRSFDFLRRRLPGRSDPWAAAAPFPGSEFEAPRGTERRWAVEIARSPLFDNCLTAFSTEDRLEVPAQLLDWFPAGEWFFRRAREIGRHRWETTDVFVLDVPS